MPLVTAFCVPERREALCHFSGYDRSGTVLFLLVTSATLVVTSALLVVTRSY